jgi:hypothetical protein
VKTASEDDRALANSFLKAFGAAHADEFHYRGPPREAESGGLKRKAVKVVARAANFVGDEEPLQRLERVERAEAQADVKKKR